MYIEEPLYAPHPMVYETPYAYAPPPDYMTHRPRMSLNHHPDYIMANLYNKHRRTSRFVLNMNSLLLKMIRHSNIALPVMNIKIF